MGTSVGTYDRLPGTIRAIQWAGDNLELVADFVGVDATLIHDGNMLSVCPVGEEAQRITTGAWVVRGVDNEVYTMPPDRFVKLYGPHQRDLPAHVVLNQARIARDVAGVIEDMHTYKKPDDDQIPAFAQVRDYVIALHSIIVNVCPPCPDRTTAVRKLREVRMWANAAIALKGRF